MESTTITLLLTSITAISAIVMPVMSTWIASKSNERIKKTELIIPRTYDEMGALVEAYSMLVRSDPMQIDFNDGDRKITYRNAQYRNFMAAAYKVMSLLPDAEAQSRLAEFMTCIVEEGKFASEHTDELFNNLMTELTKCIVESRQRFRRKPRKRRAGRQTHQ